MSINKRNSPRTCRVSV